MASLFVVATPIGNLEDITLRALRTLKSVQFVIAEDTRVARKLLAHFEIRKPLERFDEHISDERVSRIVSRIAGGEDAALVTDAGTPSLSDPGWRLVAASVKQGISVVPIPGPSALATVVSIAHFPPGEFVFYGFPPAKKGRESFFDRIARESRGGILYESSHRIAKTLKELANRVPSRELVVAKELTKIYERVWRGSAAEVCGAIDNITGVERKGEWVVVISHERKK